LGAIEILLEKLPSKKTENLRFAIAGDGPQREILERLIERRKLSTHVKLLGYRKNIPHLMKSADFFVLPSIREAFGFVNLEAMISNLPIIATHTGGIPEILKDNKTALLVEPRSERSLANAIEELISSKSLRTKFAKIGKTVVESTFDAKIMVKKYEKEYGETLRSGTRFS